MHIMFSAGAAVLTAALLSASPAPNTAESPPAAPGGARISGMLAFRLRNHSVPLAEVQRLSGGKRIGLSLRRGWAVIPARIGEDGRFLADVSPGTWRLEWIDVGERAEALASPLVIDARAGATSCAGAIEISFDDLESELGANAGGTVRVEDRCRELGGGASLARPANDPPADLDVDVADVIAGIRTEISTAGKHALALRASWAFPFRRPAAWRGSIIAIGAASRVFSDSEDHFAFEAGAGFSPLNGFELAAGGRLRTAGPSGIAPWAGIRWGGLAYALNARAVFESDGVAWHVGLDLTPFFVLGSSL